MLIESEHHITAKTELRVMKKTNPYKAMLAVSLFTCATCMADVVYDGLLADPPGVGGSYSSTDYRFKAFRGNSSELGTLNKVTIGSLVTAGHSTAGFGYSLDVYDSSANLLGTYGITQINTLSEDYFGYDVLAFSFDVDVDVAKNDYVLFDFNTDDSDAKIASPDSGSLAYNGWSMDAGVDNFTRYFSGYSSIEAIPEPSVIALSALFGSGLLIVRRIFMI